jgi:hypothetical protein
LRTSVLSWLSLLEQVASFSRTLVRFFRIFPWSHDERGGAVALQFAVLIGRAEAVPPLA